MRPYCDMHEKSFSSWHSIKQHYVQHKDHFYCQTCNEHYYDDEDLQDHFDTSHEYCRMHGMFFKSWQALKEHFVQSGDHLYCQYCNDHFDSTDDFMEHGEDYHWACRMCVKIFGGENAFKQHKQHSHHYCEPCDRLFTSAANLNAHLASSIHQPRNLQCPGRACNRAFVSLSALILHAESGACASGVTRRMVDQYVVKMDRNNVITNPNRLLTGGAGASARGSGGGQVEWYATGQSWNGYAFECFLCYKCFGSLSALNAHLASPTHQAKIYRCPTGSGGRGGCGIEFSTLSALCQHVERGSCGVQRFREVKNIMDSLQGGMRAIAL